MRVRAGDFTDPRSLDHAFEGADRVLVVSAAIRGGGAVEANVAAIDAAHRAGAPRILYTSHQAASATSQFAPQRTHAATEDHLQRLGLPFTALRNGFYVSTLGHHLGQALATGRLALPEDGPVSWTAHDDLAEAAVVALTEDGALDGATPPLTAHELLTFDDVARILADLTGRPIERVVLADEEWVAEAVGRGMPRAAAEFTLGMFQAARAGEFAVTDPALGDIIGHEPRSALSYLAAAVAAS